MSCLTGSAALPKGFLPISVFKKAMSPWRAWVDALHSLYPNSQSAPFHAAQPSLGDWSRPCNTI